MAMRPDNLNRFEDLAERYPWMKKVIDGEDGIPAVKKRLRNTSKRYSAKQIKIVKRGQ